MSRPGKAVLILPLISFGLGTWQLQRLEWKKGVIKEMEDKQKHDPIDFELKYADDQVIKDNEYRKYKLTGVFDYSKEFHVGPRFLLDAPPGSEPGVHIVSPFTLTEGPSSGDRILVNRGWVPNSRKDPQIRSEGNVTDIQTIFGILRKSANFNRYAPKNQPEINKWHTLDVLAMAEEAETNPVLLDQTSDVKPPSGLPIPGQTRINIPNDHLQYAITWYSLSVAIVILYFTSK